MTDLIARGEPFAWIDGGARRSNGFVGYIEKSKVLINLNEHTIDARERGRGGISAGGAEGTVTRIVVKNGAIRSKTGAGISFIDSVRLDVATPKDDFFSISKRNPSYRQMDENHYREFLILLQKLKTHFPMTEHRLESLDITSKYQSINIRGGGNTIINNHLHTTGISTSLELSGPDQLIEGNTIVISAGDKNVAPITLKMADRSVIRNNTIIVEGFGDKPEAAISLMDSKNVRIENNKIIGIDKLYEMHEQRADQKSSVIEGQGERANEFISGWRRFFMK